MTTMQPPTTARALRLAREGAGLTQCEAAAKVGIRPPSLNVYETGAVLPSDTKLRQLVRSIALGEPQEDAEPQFVTAFDLVGIRYLADARGRVLVFTELETAAHAVGVMSENGLPN